MPQILPAGLLRDTSLDASRFVPSEDTIVHNILIRLSEEGDDEGKPPKDLSTNLGWNFYPDSWATDEKLPRPLVSIIHFDWMHCYFIDGLFTKEVRPQ